MFIACYGTAQIFHLKDWRKVALVLAPISFIIAVSVKISKHLLIITTYFCDSSCISGLHVWNSLSVIGGWENSKEICINLIW